MLPNRAAEITPAENSIRRSTLVTVIVDVILIMALVGCLLLYIARNNIDTYNQNIENISSIAQAEAELLGAALDNTGREVQSAYEYCRGKDLKDILDYLALISISDDEYQLLKRDDEVSTDLYQVYIGYSTHEENGEYTPVVYEDTALAESLYSYSNCEEGEVFFSQSFTNKTDAQRYFSVFCGISVKENGTTQKYYLVKPQKESRLLDQLQTYTQYGEMSVAVCYIDGKYLACDNGFRSNNFYDYLYDYNGLSIDERNEIRASVQRDMDGVGELNFRDFKGRDCVFSYASNDGVEKWNVIIAVPESEFVESKLISFFPLIIIVFLAVLLAFNVWRLLVIVGQLRMSVERERVANASKGSFLSRMSHEIRTPLNAVIGYNAIAKTELSGAKDDVSRRKAEMKVMDCLDKSEIASRHLLTILNDVLDMSAIESGRIKVAQEKFDFSGLISSLSAVFSSQAQAKGIDFEVIFDTLTEKWFLGDQMRTNQILTNLLSNAVKFTPAGGVVTLRISQPDADDAARLHFEVSDTGIGMTSEYLSHIWTPFEQADSSISRRFGGTGLGLSITKNLVDLMGGTISVDSAPGAGTTFTVELSFERTEQPDSDETYNFSDINALVVDDDPNTCDYIGMLFARSGASCTCVKSGADAVSAVADAARSGKRYSMCLIDWKMPNMNGIETVRRIREIEGGDMPVAILTAYDYTEIADEAADVGVTRFMSKPLFQSSLFDLLANHSGMQAPRKKDKSISFNGARVLLAEDNAMNVEIAKAILKSVGINAISALNGREAVDMFEASAQGEYAAILMDVHMPVMNGHEATRIIRASLHPDARTIPIIAMTADAFAENVAEAHESGMNDHIAKPIDVPAFYATLAKYIKSSES